ncbi:triple QxxK/R motif-containing protein isoform X2 [Cololabis saira]|uniref:triple QxxK/R motif-containing protein isoform X2 n=1 Tax=Cololabis saira TaxID=129043 RepID=UPI002AD3C33B|nr:triple QxxK/R motif-containing protein isoform X2 [Cololabis saira]
MGRKDASATNLPVDQYRKQIGKQDYKKSKSALKATRLHAEAKKNSSVLRVRHLDRMHSWSSQRSFSSCSVFMPSSTLT